MKFRPLIVIAGPTGVGKTDVAHYLAIEMGGEIVSADSRQVYRYLDIGTAKPSSKFCQQIPYHMIDIVDPDEDFSVADFKQQAEMIIDQIHLRGKLPFLVGGTGLYIKSIVSGLVPAPPPSPCLRQQLQEEASVLGTNHLYQRLFEIDPETASRISSNDLRRIIRALEVYCQTGTTISCLKLSATATKDYHLTMIVLNQDRQQLYARIEQRVDRMIEMGWVEEVQGLLEKGYSSAREASESHQLSAVSYQQPLTEAAPISSAAPQLISMEALGYRQIIKHLQGIYSLQEAVAEIKQSSRQFAKRQLTWFRADSKYNWFEPDNIAGMREIITKGQDSG
ncbi:MAG: tRNA (adenosine(37)-N6)-dimethylallyltransferase MiaA [bacterium]